MFGVVQVVHGREGLAGANAAVVRGQHAVQKHAEAFFAKQIRGPGREQTVLEHAAGERAKAAPLPGLTCWNSTT